MDFEERDFFKDRLSEAEVQELAKIKSLSNLFSWRSPSFKTLGLDQGSLSSEDLVRLMIEEPRLMRRPLIKVGQELIIGGNEGQIRKALGKG